MTESGDLQRAVDRLQSAITNQTSVQQDLADAVKELRSEIRADYVRKDVNDKVLAGMQKEINASADWITWATRIVVALVIVAVVGLVINAGGGAPV